MKLYIIIWNQTQKCKNVKISGSEGKQQMFNI
jgi:hypothetical protein